MASDLKCDFMCKRSQMKGKFKAENYKNRWFKLNAKTLGYYDGNLDKIGRSKGQVQLNSVLAVEELDSESLGKQNAFQVVYKAVDAGISEVTTLCIIAVGSGQMTSWIEAIRQACIDSGARFASKYHPGIWMHKLCKYSCCDNINKRMVGCQPTTCSAEKSADNKGKNGPLSNGSDGKQPVELRKSQEDGECNKVLALYDYEAGEKNELSLVKGEEYELLEAFKPDEWLKAKNKQKKSGVIPASYVQLLGTDDLQQYDWYYKKTSRLQSESILENDGSEGCFMVRDSSQKGVYTLSIYVKTPGSTEGHTKHYHIKQNKEGQYYVADKHMFASITQMIYYHKHNCAGLIVRLRSPPNDGKKPTPLIGTKEINPDDLVIKEILGSGQFGTVSKGIYNGKTEVAVKTMKEGTMSESDFIDEAKVMTKLQHENLVKLYGVCTTRKPLLIVTEFMKHGALLSFLRRQKHRLKDKTDQLFDMSMQVCSAMEYLEKQRFIHRDLAARNCLVGENNVIKVADFGLARYVLDDEYTCSQGAKFPVRWSAPEVLSNNLFSSKSDVWAFGILMWEIFTCGDLPYGKEIQNHEIFEIVCNNKQYLTRPEKCPKPAYDLMIGCWKYEPEERPNFDQLCSELRQIQERDYED